MEKNSMPLNVPVYNHWNYREYAPKAKLPKCFFVPSLTVPDLALTMDELLVRYERGLPLPVQKTPLWDDPNIPSTGKSIVTMDLIDIHYYQKSYRQRLDVLTDSINKVREENAKRLNARKMEYEDAIAYVNKHKNDSKGDISTNTP